MNEKYNRDKCFNYPSDKYANDNINIHDNFLKKIFEYDLVGKEGNCIKSCKLKSIYKYVETCLSINFAMSNTLETMLIYCDGDMKFRHKENGETWLRTTSDLADFGVGTEEELRESYEKELIDWDMNPWFDLYIDGEHMDCVSGTLSEALSLASAYVVRQHAEAELLMGIDIF